MSKSTLALSKPIAFLIGIVSMLPIMHPARAQAPETEPVVGRLAPELGAAKLHWRPRAISVLARRMGPDQTRIIWITDTIKDLVEPPTLKALDGLVLIVHHTSTAEVERWSSLIDLAEANYDRGALLVSVATDEEKELVAARHHSADSLGIVVGLAQSPESPYSGATISVVGRNGELVARTLDMEALGTAVEQAMQRPRAGRLDRALAPEFDPALRDYWNGRFSKARDQARRILGKHERAADPAGTRLREDAAHLIEVVDQLEQRLLERVRGCIEHKSVVELFVSAPVLAHGFDGPQARIGMSERARLRHDPKFSDVANGLEEEAKLLDARPLYFPRRCEPKHEAYAKRLAALVKDPPPLDGDGKESARALLARYRARCKGG